MRYAPPLSSFSHYPVTGGTCLLATLVYALQVTGHDVSALEGVGYRVMAGEVWRLLTTVLPHGSPFHLLFNLYWTWTLGALAEHKFGSLKTGLLFVYLALVSSGMEYAFLTGGIGLSGVGYGLFGVFWGMRGLDADADIAADRNTTYLFLGWGVICVIGTVMGTMTPIANIAHGMGFVAGAVVGKAIVAWRGHRRVYFGAAAGVLVVASLVLSTVGRQYVNYTRRMNVDLYDLAQAQARAGNLAASDRTMKLLVRRGGGGQALIRMMSRDDDEDGR